MADFPNTTGRFPEDTKKLIDLLNAVNFARSPLPQEVLGDFQPGTRKCKLEYTVQVKLIGLLEHARQRVRVDLRPIDEKLINLAMRLEVYVRSGDAVSARMAVDALEKGIGDIRCNIPQNPEIPPEKFVRINADYLSKWIDLVQWAELYDQTTKKLNSQRQLHKQAEDQLNQAIDNICTRIDTEPEFAATFFHILEHDTQADRGNWTKTQHDVHMMLVEHRFSQVTRQASNMQMITLEQDQLALKQKIDTLHLFLNSVPIVTDPNLLNKHEESMQQFIRDMAESDAFTAEIIRQTDELEGAMKQLEDRSFTNRQRSAAAESARNTLDQILRLGQDDAPQSQDSRLKSDNHT